MQFNETKKSFFTGQLMIWFGESHRPLPWKGIKDAYLIWLSEIILQQTRVVQGLPYYQRFQRKYPTVHHLAAAPEDEVFKLWEGLGYYTRARNLHATARYISENLDGIFPQEYDRILALKGVGPYTAAAIASFAYDLPHAVVDGNVFRVLSRFFGIEKEIDSTEGKKLFTQLADELLDREQPADYNQAIMDFGATQCVPKSPNCGICPLRVRCMAFQHNEVQNLPRKGKKLTRRRRFFNFILFNSGESVFIEKRKKNDIWKNLYQFPLIETPSIIENFSELRSEVQLPSQIRLIRNSKPYRQLLTHQQIIARFWEFELESAADFTKENLISVKRENLGKFAFPKVIDLYLQDNSLYLELL